MWSINEIHHSKTIVLKPNCLERIGKLSITTSEMGNKIAYKLWALIHKKQHLREKEEAQQNNIREQKIRWGLSGIKNKVGINKEKSSWARVRKMWKEE